MQMYIVLALLVFMIFMFFTNKVPAVWSDHHDLLCGSCTDWSV